MPHKQYESAHGTCSDCKQSADFKLEDFGIGAYEYWGARGTHHDYQWVSTCCEAPDDGDLHLEEYIPSYDPCEHRRY